LKVALMAHDFPAATDPQLLPPEKYSPVIVTPVIVSVVLPVLVKVDVSV
jgi:hypothetical protein